MATKTLKVGDTYEEVIVENLTRTQIVQYAGASGDYNPVHTDEIFATQIAKYPSVFAHGMLTMGMTGKAITNYVGDGRLAEYGVRFSKQVWPGDTLRTTLTVTKTWDEDGESFAELSVETKNENGDTVVIGSAVARVGGE